MKPCLKASRSPPPVLCTHRKCVAFGAQISEEVHIADEWDRTPTEPTRKLTYQDLLELKAIQRSLPHANQPCDLTGGRQFLSQVPMALVPLLPQPVPCKLMQMHIPLLDTPPSSGSCSPYSSRTSSPPSLTHTSLDSSPHSSPDSHPFLPLLLDDPDPHPLFPSSKPRRKPKKKKFIIVNDIEMEMDDSDSDSESDSEPGLDHLELEHLKHGDEVSRTRQQFKQFEPQRSATPPSTPTQEEELDLDPPNSTLFCQVSMSNTPPWSRDTSHPTPSSLLSSSPRFPQPPSLITSCRESPSPLSPSTPTSSPKSRSPTTTPPINLHIPMRFKRSGSGSCLSPCSSSGAVATPALSRVRGV